MPEQVSVAQAGALKDGDALCVTAGDKELALFRIGDEFYAIDNECPHHGAPLCDGWTDGTTVTCPWHCWQFDVTDGQCLTVEGFDVPSYPVRIENGEVKVEV